MKKALALGIALALLLSFAALAGCGKKEAAQKKEDQQLESGQEQDQGGEEGRQEGTAILMTGRSVMSGWMEHWGYDWEGPVSKNGYLLDYRELDADLGNIAGSFREDVEDLPEGSTVFFKFCFADFLGDNLSQLENIIKEVIEIARDNKLRLVIGNALPVRKEDSPDGLPSEYREYNAFLEQKAEEYPDVWVYDFYGILAGPDGFLKPEYDTGDSHPSQEAYTALDKTFFPFLGGILKQ